MTDMGTTPATPPPPPTAPYGLVTPEMVAALRATGPWARFVSIMMFIGAGMMFLLALLMTAFGTAMTLPNMGPEAAPMGAVLGPMMGFVYVVVGILYIVFGCFLFGFANRVADMKRAVDLPTFTWAMSAALAAQRRFWKSLGVVLIASLILYGVGILLVIVLVIVGFAAAAR